MRQQALLLMISVGMISCSLSDLDRFYLAADASVTCGNPGVMCCPPSTCNGDALCMNGQCIACGDPTQPCCGTSCHSGATCMAGTCNACGAAEQPCCGATCNTDTLLCEAGTCRACIKQVVTGGSHACAVKSDGTVWCWGANADGQLGVATNGEIGPIPASISNVVEIGAGRFNTCAVKGDGTVWCWGALNEILSPASGSLTNGVPVQIQQLPAAERVALGFNHACAVVSSDHSVWCWGKNDVGQVGQMPNGSTVLVPQRVSQWFGSATAIAAGFAHSCAALNGGTVCWGSNAFGQLGAGSTATSAYTPQGVVTTTPGGISSTTIGANFGQSCVTSVGNFAYCWGFNMFGQVGDGTTTNRSSAILVLSDAAEVSAGRAHTCALKIDHSVWCWGDNIFGELGHDPVLSQSNSPLMMSGLTTAVHIAAGGPGYSDADDFSCALLSDGSVQCWGSDLYGQIGDMRMANTPNFRPVKAAVTCR